MKRLLALLCSLALVFCLLPSTAFAEGGNGNIDGGGGSMGQGTSSNFWNPGNDGVRITVVDADSGNAISSPIDFTNRSQNNVVHFGKVNKLQYLAGTALTPQSGAGYDYTRPIQSIYRLKCFSKFTCVAISKLQGNITDFHLVFRKPLGS